jgi:L-lactate dehydrogenase complex protein LldE
VKVGLFVTCLVDAVRPEIGFSALKLLEGAGYEVVVPESQTCCGQPAYNSGDARTARELAEKVLREFEGFDYVVCRAARAAGRSRCSTSNCSATTRTSRPASTASRARPTN